MQVKGKFSLKAVRPYDVPYGRVREGVVKLPSRLASLCAELYDVRYNMNGLRLGRGNRENQENNEW